AHHDTESRSARLLRLLRRSRAVPSVVDQGRIGPRKLGARSSLRDHCIARPVQARRDPEQRRAFGRPSRLRQAAQARRSDYTVLGRVQLAQRNAPRFSGAHCDATEHRQELGAMPKFNVTYEIVTPESAEVGDAAERGFVAKGVSLREAVDLIGGVAHSADTWPCTLANPPRWFTNEAYNEGTREYFEFGR